ncbi:unnamed protein product [Auanema sp. JU1783]|nr:unnamed protein product [Auanema sp. JU1783]
MFLRNLSIIACLICLVNCKVDSTHKDIKKKQVVDTLPQEHKNAETFNHRKTYIEEFKLRREEHKEAVNSIASIQKDKQRLYIEEIRNNIKKLLTEARGTLERVQWKSEDPFPYDSDLLKTNLSKLLENISFFSELSLSYFSHFEKVMKKDRKLNTVIVWAYNYAKDTGLLDSDTMEVVDKMAKKFSIIQSSDREKMTKSDIEEEARNEQKKRKEEKSRDKKPSKKQKDSSKKVKSEL